MYSTEEGDHWWDEDEGVRSVHPAISQRHLERSSRLLSLSLTLSPSLLPAPSLLLFFPFRLFLLAAAADAQPVLHLRTDSFYLLGLTLLVLLSFHLKLRVNMQIIAISCEPSSWRFDFFFLR